MNDSAIPDTKASLRWSIYAILIAIGMGQMVGRILAVDSIDKIALEQRQKQDYDKQVEDTKQRGGDPGNIPDWRRQRPFLSGNDRSRWITMRALVEQGTYAIDDFVNQPNWDTIDMVKHRGPDGQDHLYSSKPPLLATLLAGEYCLVHRATGWTLGDHPFEIGRFMLLSLHVPAMLLLFVLLAKTAERYGTTDWARIFLVAAGVFGTLLTTFEIALNNHLIAAVCAMAALYSALRIWCDGRRHWKYFATVGLCGAFMVANELPSLALFGLLSLVLLRLAPRQTLLALTPAALLVMAGFFGTEYAAHGTFDLAYSHRNEVGQDVFAVAKEQAPFFATLPAELNQNRVPEELRAEFEKHQVALPRDAGKLEVLKNQRKTDSWWLEDKGRLKMYALDLTQQGLQVQLWDSWYYFVYDRGDKILPSYWFSPNNPIDQGEPSRAVYALHVLVGHHGIFSLTPIWLLSLWGIWKSLRRRDDSFRALAALIAVVSVACLAFYVFRPLEDRNYGGTSAGFRWAFWLAPPWLIAMLPALDAAAAKRWSRVFCLILLGFSVLSVAYPTWNPWTQPWLFNFLNYLRAL